MPKFITTLGIPEPYFSARKAFSREPRDHVLHVTDLLSPPRKVALVSKHWHDIAPSGDGSKNEPSFVIDVDDNTAAFYGGAAHAFIEATHDRNEKRERRTSEYLMEEQLEMPHMGWKIVGRPDIYKEQKTDELLADMCKAMPEAEALEFLTPKQWRQKTIGVVVDWKTMKSYSWGRQARAGYKAVKEQEDLYAFLLRWAQFNPLLGYVGITITDWSKFGRGSGGGSYPPADYVHVWYKLAPKEIAARLFIDRFHIHRNAAGTGDDDLPVCTPEERWLRDEGFAVQKEGNKKPTRVFKVFEDSTADKTKAEAVEWVQEQKKPDLYRIDHRPGENVRCQQKWCLAWQVCPVGQEFRPEDFGE